MPDAVLAQLNKVPGECMVQSVYVPSDASPAFKRGARRVLNLLNVREAGDELSAEAVLPTGSTESAGFAACLQAVSPYRSLTGA